MLSPISPRALSIDQVETPLGMMVLIHDSDGRVRSTFMTSKRACDAYSDCTMARTDTTLS